MYSQNRSLERTSKRCSYCLSSYHSCVLSKVKYVKKKNVRATLFCVIVDIKYRIDITLA